MTALPRVSILLVTKNGARYLAEVLDGIGRQRGRFHLEEVIAVDSGSRDGSVEILRQAGARVMTIPAAAFGHGKTRNLAASHARGDCLAFLTQDATPATDDWLENLLAPLAADPLVVGAYSRHTPRPSCHPMEWRRIVEEEMTGRPDSRVNSRVDNPDYERNPAFFTFFANTSSIIRRSTWRDVPWPEVEFGEDHVWAKQVLEAGYKTAYCADSVVYHSHGYGPWANFRRHFDHFAALHQEMGRPPSHLAACLPEAVRTARTDLAFWARERGQTKTRVVCRWALPALGWHLAARLGVWCGERAEKFPDWLQTWFSYQVYIKRQ
ncbi:MAG: glycosyltransferase family 2 protein [Desulfurellaceae bacterium]|nr:glycosyltransferase family 2 protein [Desulfurellaceae bacterium]